MKNRVKREKRPYSLDEIKKIMKAVCEAIKILHDKDITHCDIKP
jgi:serine/threonine protein kinase